MTAPLLPGLFDGPRVEMRRSTVSEPVRLAASAQRVLTALREARGGWLANHELCRPEIGGLRAVGNYFSSGDGDGDCRVCRELVALGYMTERASPVSPDRLFHVTPRGIEVVKGTPEASK